MVAMRADSTKARLQRLEDDQMRSSAGKSYLSKASSSTRMSVGNRAAVAKTVGTRTSIARSAATSRIGTRSSGISDKKQ